jgi:hypothetical protein
MKEPVDAFSVDQGSNSEGACRFGMFLKLHQVLPEAIEVRVE